MEINENLYRYQGKAIETLKFVADFCEENNLKYYLAFGTLLGAVRHKDVIPWDDDVDIWMPREDFDRFLEIFQGYSERYTIANDHSTPNYKNEYLGMKILDKNTRIERHGIETFLWIDIFPLDGMPAGKSREKYINKFDSALKKWNLLWTYNLPYRRKMCRNKIKNFIFAINDYTHFLSLMSMEKAENRLINALAKYKDDESAELFFSYASVYNHVKEKCIYEKEWFEPSVKGELRGLEFNIPNCSDKVLKTLYKDYMKLPPESERDSRHCMKIID